jgi:tryptophan-rich sensory protein
MVLHCSAGWAKQAEPLTIYAIQLALNMAWTPLFFAAHALGAASLDIIGAAAASLGGGGQ